MRNNIVAGNWKMNNDATQTTTLINDLNKALEEVSVNCRVLISPTSINLTSAVALTQDSVIEVAAQNMHQAKNGAFTGEISAAMLNDVGIKSVILGHSERRTYFGEDGSISYWLMSLFGPLEQGKLQVQNKLKKCMHILEVYW